jgi:hypothetical protein
MKPLYWYQSGRLRKRIGQITEHLGLGYVELIDLETGQYVIRHFNKLEKTK